MTETKTRGRLTLLLISAIFFAPILLAMYLYFSDVEWRPATGTQKGNLVLPPVTLPDIALNSDEARFREVWSLVVLSDGNCDATCIEALEHTRQIRLSLGPKMTRMQVVLLPLETTTAESISTTEFPRLVISDISPSGAIHELVKSWRNGEIFLVDPLGNLMMSYPPGTEMGDIRKDLGHLLKQSTIG